MYHPEFFLKMFLNTCKEGPRIILSVCTDTKISSVLSRGQVIEQTFISIQDNTPSCVLQTHIFHKHSDCLPSNEIISERIIVYIFPETVFSMLLCLPAFLYKIYFMLFLFFNTWRR